MLQPQKTITATGIGKAPDNQEARIVFVDQLRAMYLEGTLDKSLTESFNEVPYLLLSDLFPRLFPLLH